MKFARGTARGLVLLACLTFTQPRGNTTPPRSTVAVTGMTPAPATVTRPPSDIVVTFSAPVDPTTIGPRTVIVIRAGPDGILGTADDVQMTPTAISLTTATQLDINFAGQALPNDLYQVTLLGTVPVSSGRVAWWKFDETTGTTAADSSGNGNTGTLVGNPQWMPNGGKLGGALSFNGVSDYVVVSESPSLEPASAISVCMWANISTVSSSFADLLRKEGIQTPGYLMRWYQSGDFLDWRLNRNLNPSIYVEDTQPTTTYLNSWHHFAGTYDSSTGISSIYVDGTLRASLTGQTGPLEHTDALYMMFGPQSLQQPVGGLLDDVRIYSRCLSAQEIQLLAGSSSDLSITDPSGNPLDGEFSGTFPSGDGTPGGNFVATFTISSGAPPPPPPAPPQVIAMSPAPGSVQSSVTSITVSLNHAVSPSTVNPSTCRLYRPGPDGIFGTADDIEVTPASVQLIGGTQIVMGFTGVPLPNDQYEVLLSGEQISTTGLVAHWEFNEGSGATAADSSGNGNSGTLSGPIWAQGKVGGALSFNGNLDHVLIGKPSISPPWTAGFWVNGQPSPNNDARLMDSQAYPIGCSIRFEQYNNTQMLGVTRYGVADYAFSVASPFNAWTHLTYVGTSTTTSVYVNGALAGSVPNEIEIPMYFLGSQGGHTLLGLMGDTAIYNVELSPAEIKALAAYPGAVIDPAGKVLDGEFSGSFPSGDGVSGGNFAAVFTIGPPSTPPASTAGPAPVNLTVGGCGLSGAEAIFGLALLGLRRRLRRRP